MTTVASHENSCNYFGENISCCKRVVAQHFYVLPQAVTVLCQNVRLLCYYIKKLLLILNYQSLSNEWFYYLYS